MRALWMAFAVCLVLSLPATASAAAWGVDDATDTPVGQACGGFTGCSLREAITSTEANPGPDAILVAAGTYPLTFGELGITQSLTITKVGAGSVIIDAASASRAFLINGGVSTDVTLDGFTIRNGAATNSPGSPTIALGGAIYSDANLTLDTLTVTASSATGSTSSLGGGLYHVNGSLSIVNSHFTANSIAGGAAPNTVQGGGIATNFAGPITMTDVEIGGNSAVSAAAASGGGARLNGGTTAVLTRVSIHDNLATSSDPGLGARGGGLWVNALTSLTISDSSIADNTLTHLGAGNRATGGGVNAAVLALSVTGTAIRGNRAIAETGEAYGGGLADIAGGGTATIDQSRITGNSVRGSIAYGGGAYTESPTPLSIVASTLDDNGVTGTTGGDVGGGGAAIRNGGILAFTNSTVYANVVTGTAGGAISGGGVFGGSGTTITATTIAANQLARSGPAGTSLGGGLSGRISTSALTITGSILSGNVQPAADADCGTAVLTSGGGNVINQVNGTSGCAFVADASDVITASPDLGSLGDHGGPTPTAMPTAASPAFQRYTTGCPATDQRGVTRPQIGASCDSGAVELRPASFTSNPAARAFGSVTTGTTSAPQTVLLTNEGDISQAPSLAFSGAGASQFSVGGCGTAVALGASCTASISFAPTSDGAKSASMTGAAPVVAVTGTGTPAAAPPAATGMAPACQDLVVGTAFATPAPVTLTCAPIVWSWQVVSAPSDGTLSPIDAAGRLTYTPAAGFSGVDTFTYRSAGLGGQSAPAVVRVTVGPGPAPGPDQTPAHAPSAGRRLTCQRVPDLVGRTTAQARRVLQQDGCRAPLDVTRRRARASRRHHVVRVIAQSPKPGTPRFDDERVTITVR